MSSVSIRHVLPLRTSQETQKSTCAIRATALTWRRSISSLPARKVAQGLIRFDTDKSLAFTKIPDANDPVARRGKTEFLPPSDRSERSTAAPQFH